MTRSFLILHGVNGSGLDHWQTHLAQKLRQCGETVFYPELSGKEEPDCAVWLAELEEQLSSIPDPENLTVVCHSLACILWMHYALDPVGPPVGRLILVAPPGPGIVEEFRPTFHPLVLDREALDASASRILLICTGADPRCPEQAAECYGRPLGLEMVLLEDRAAHINTASGFGDWPGMAALCLGGGLAGHLAMQVPPGLSAPMSVDPS